MSRILRDSIDPAILRQFPAALIGGYVDGIFGPNHAAFGEPGWDAPQWDTFPGAVLVRIAVFASTDDGHVGDCETGDMTPQQAPGWVRMRREAGQDPTVYHSWSGWADVRDEFAAQGVPEPWWWIAFYGITPRLFTQDDRGRDVGGRCVAHQYAGSAETGHNYDESLVADYWPGVDEVLDPNDPIVQRLIGPPNAQVDIAGFIRDIHDGMGTLVSAGGPALAYAIKAELDALKAEVEAGGSLDAAAAIARIEKALQAA